MGLGVRLHAEIVEAGAIERHAVGRDQVSVLVLGDDLAFVVGAVGVRDVVDHVEAGLTGLDGEIDLEDAGGGGGTDRGADGHAAGRGGLHGGFPAGRSRHEEVERTVVGVVPGGLAVVVEEERFVDRHLPAGGFEQEHVLRDLGGAGLLGHVEDF